MAEEAFSLKPSGEYTRTHRKYAQRRAIADLVVVVFGARGIGDSRASEGIVVREGRRRKMGLGNFNKT